MRLRNKRSLTLLLAACALAGGVLWSRLPLHQGPLTKQTLYVMMAHACCTASDAEPAALWIDDDSGDGMGLVKALCDELDIKATFAVVPGRLSETNGDSLAAWQRQGFGVAIHGLNHDHWRTWGREQIEADIAACRQRMGQAGIDTSRLSRIVVPPHADNTMAIRGVVARQGCHIVTGACTVNPSASCFMWGRLWIDADTDTTAMGCLLEKARRRNAFVVFGTHSSQANEFAADKTRAVLRRAKELGFVFR